MKHEHTRKIFEYWCEIRAGKQLPDRSEIEPSAIAPLLGDVFILCVSPTKPVEYRLAGTRVCSVYDTELKRRAFSQTWLPKDGATVEDFARSAGKEENVIVIGSKAGSRQGRELALETILLPLTHAGSVSRRVLGATAALEKPYWLGIDPVVTQAITGIRVVKPDLANVFAASRPIEWPDGAGERPLLMRGRRVGHLTVVDGGQA